MSVRRSARGSGARKSYTNDPFDAVGLEEEEDEEAIEQSITYKGKGKRRRESDDEFDEAAAASAEQAFKEEDDEEEEEEGLADELAQSDGSGDFELTEPTIDASTAVSVSNANRARKRRTDGSTLYKSEDTHSRGAYNPSEHVGKSMHIKLTFGLDNRDLLAAASARTQWSLGVDATFPTRASLENTTSAAHYGPGSTHGISAADLEREATEAWNWYHDADSGLRFRERQRVEKIDMDHAQQKFLYRPQKNSHKVIYGPGENLSTAYLRQYESLNFGEAWKYRDETHKSGTPVSAGNKANRGRSKKTTSGPAASKRNEDEPPKITESQRRKNRYGWILNLSGKIQALGWAPNQDGLTQYLAVSVPISSEQEKQYDPSEPPAASRAFSPSSPYPGAIQIWSFDAEDRKDGIVKTVDINRKPTLRLVLCMEFGHIRKIHWCPMPRRRRDEEDNFEHDLGLLACVFSDGRTRVFNIKVDRNVKTTEYLYVKSAAFTAMPSPTISSCLAWLSPTDIAVGCANGWVAVYNLLAYQVISKLDQQEDDPIPYIYIPVHSTYITNLETAYPQHPHLISTAAMDGNTRLTSLFDPVKDMVDTTRQRLGNMQISYYPYLQAFVSSDEHDAVRGLSVRRFFTSTSIGRLPSAISAIANGSRWHPSVMAGCTEGSIYIFNPLRRFMHAKESHFHARWFLHEWAAGKDEQTPNTSRFMDDIEVESLSLLRSLKADGKIVNGMLTLTIYDEEQHITNVDWNSNQHCAGWAAAGMGSGLVRVEDLAMFH
ncbi:hypothetical protein UA08_01621 [Talaromyces atroroseus]|uniref:Transcription factor TFIIIC complex subunit Tfc6 n=1 Tax=Talaromyces atroroseus TaxID=1441469 RepID=A0A1Q5QB36_TALAT|nr:hypothetical protein UA08_01621 [Talaromyces atroroseus]OKL63136.1 hypothetical protein UA08_01621 [Talaromyces atroroseus]